MAAFDPIKYRQTTREQWQTAAAAWHRWGPLLSDWLDPATELMLNMAGVGAGNRVLDVAAGAGGQTFVAARRVGASGFVLATDISANIATQVADGEQLEVELRTFDAVISRVGLIYFPDQQRALEGTKKALKPGGRIAAIVYSTAEMNGFFSVPVSIIRRRAQLPPRAPGQPGPFSLGGPGVLERLFREAGFGDIQVRAVPAPVRMRSASECVRFERESFGALHQMLSGLDDAGREASWQEIATELAKFETPSSFVGPCELLIGVGTA
jgi:SAM-dependent methyltransferase